jgi:hypothetical protein
MSLLLAITLLCTPITAGSLAGVSLPDTATVAGQTLLLNGLGLREKYFIDVYVGGLYLPSKTSDANQAITSDVPKRIVMHFIYDDVSRDKLAETFIEGLDKYPQYAQARPKMEQCLSYLTEVTSGDQIVLDYEPAMGTTITIKGQAQPPIEGRDFMELIWSLFIGSKPATEKLKAGMMGG